MIILGYFLENFKEKTTSSELMKAEKDIFDALKAAADAEQSTPSAQTWERLEAKLATNRRPARRLMPLSSFWTLMIALVAVVLLAAMGFLWFTTVQHRANLRGAAIFSELQFVKGQFSTPPQYQTYNEWACQPVEGKTDTLRAMNSSFFKKNLVGFSMLEFRHQLSNNILVLKSGDQTKIFNFREKKVENNASNPAQIRYIFQNPADQTQIHIVKIAESGNFELVFWGGNKFNFFKN